MSYGAPSTNATAGTMPFAKSKPGKAGEVNGKEHTSGARPSTAGTHEKGQTRKQQVNRDKKDKIQIGKAINNIYCYEYRVNFNL